MGKLLLKCDGVLAEAWCPLDPEPPYQPPDRWNAPHVAHRYAEAIAIVLRLPAGKIFPPGFRNSWPDWERDWDLLMGRCTDIEAMAAEGRVSLNSARRMSNGNGTAIRCGVIRRPRLRSAPWNGRSAGRACTCVTTPTRRVP